MHLEYANNGGRYKRSNPETEQRLRYAEAQVLHRRRVRQLSYGRPVESDSGDSGEGKDARLERADEATGRDLEEAKGHVALRKGCLLAEKRQGRLAQTSEKSLTLPGT